MKYDVTIGIPVYRAVDFIENTLISALNQTFQSIEFLVVDDCGEDGSMDIVNRLKADHPRGNDIFILCNSYNLGVGGTRNRILDESRGRYLFFLDSDDQIEPDTIECLYEKIREEMVDVVYGSLDKIDMINNMPTETYMLPNDRLMYGDDMALFAFKNYKSFQISVCNCLMNVEFLRSSNLRFMDTAFWEDLAFTYEMVTKVSRAVLLSKITYHYLCHSDSLSHYQDREYLKKEEILNNIHTINCLKDKCRCYLNKIYLPYLCYNLEMNSFYIVCHILKHNHRIIPKFSPLEMHEILHHPLSLRIIMRFRRKKVCNIVLWIMGKMPPLYSLLLVRLIDIIKRMVK